MNRAALPGPAPHAVVLAVVLAVTPDASRAVAVWDDETNLSATATDSESGLNHRPMAITPDGTLHVVWAEKDGPDQNHRIYTRRLASGTWSPAQRIVDYLPSDPGANGGAKYPALAVTPDGSVHLFWHDYRVGGIDNVEIFTKVRPPGGPWDPGRDSEIRLTTTSHPETQGDNGYVPVPAAAEDGTLHVLWYDFRYDGFHAEILSKTRAPGGAWDLSPGDSADVRVTNDTDHSELVAVDVDASGHVHAAWRSVGGAPVVRYARRDAGTETWSSPIAVDGAGAVAGAPALAVDGAGRVHVVWPDGRDGGRALYTRVREVSGVWSAAARLTRPEDGADEPSLDAAPDGTLHLVWHDGRVSLFNREVFHREKAWGSPWDTTGAGDFRVSEAAGSSVRPSVLATGGDVFVLWKDARDGNHEIYFRRGGQIGTSAPPSPDRPASLVARPNPFRGGTIHFVREDGTPPGPLEILDVTGRRIRLLAAGPAWIAWDGRASTGAPVGPGVYFVRSGRDPALRVTVIR